MKVFFAFVFGCIFTLGLVAEDFIVSATEDTKMLIPFMQQIFEDAGLTPVFKIYPSERSNIMLNNGDVQALFFRSEAALAFTPNAIKINVPFTQVPIVAVSLKPGITITTPSDLKNYTVGIVRSHRIVTEFFTGWDTVVYGPDEMSLLKMLKAERFDVAIITATSIPLLLKDFPLPGLKIHSPPVFSYPIYVFIHKSQRALVPKLTETFRKWLENGAWETEVENIRKRSQEAIE